MVVFTVVPLGVGKYWDKVDAETWLNKFDKELKMQSYKSPDNHF